MKKKFPLSIFEIVAYSILAALGLWGLVYIVLGVVVEFLNPVKDALYATNKSFGALGFLYQGFIILAVAVAAAVVILLIFAKSSDRDYEKAQRRAARLAKDDVVVAEATEIKEEY